MSENIIKRLLITVFEDNTSTELVRTYFDCEAMILKLFVGSKVLFILFVYSCEAIYSADSKAFGECESFTHQSLLKYET